jgi:GH25 family lysozyme M1 (1,4-beta-N-acetylmuramidase)
MNGLWYMDVANPMVRDKVVQANIEVVVQGGATRTSYVIVWFTVHMALAKQPCAGWYVGYKHVQYTIFSSSPDSKDGGDKNDLQNPVHA